MSQICIVGAGVSGLTMAYCLVQNGWDVKVQESAQRVGGAIRTVKKDGFLLEHGPNSVLGNSRYHTFLREIGLDRDIVAPLPTGKTRFIAKKNRSAELTLVAVPQKVGAMLSSRLLSSSAKLRLLADPFIGSTDEEDESIHNFFCRRLGPEFAECVIAPIITGIWASSSRNLSIRASMPQVWRAEKRFGSLIFPLLAAKGFKSRSAPGYAVSFVNGMQQLPVRIAELLASDERVVLSSPANEDNLRTYERVFFTTNSKHCASIIRTIRPRLAEQIENLPSVPVGILHLGIPRADVKHSLEGFGFVVPPIYRRSLRAVIFSSSVFPGRAPSGFHLLTCFLGTDPRDYNEQRIVFEELDELIGLSSSPVVLDAVHHPCALPNYPVGHHNLQEQLDEFNREQAQIRIVSSWHRGLSVSQRVDEAMNAASQVCSPPI